MSIENIGAQTQPVKTSGIKKQDAAFAGLTGLIAGGATGYFTGEAMPGPKLATLTSDTFEKELRHPNKMSAEEKEVADYIKDTLKTKENFNSSIEEATNEYFGGAKELSVNDFIKKSTGGKFTTPEQLEKSIKGQESYAETISARINAMKDKLIDAKEKTSKNPAKTLKNNEHIEKLTGDIEDLSNRLNIHYENIAKNKEYIEIANLAENGNVTQKVFANFSKSKVNAALESNVAESAQFIEKYLPKVNSLKKAGIFGGISAGLLYLGYKIFGEKTEQSQPTENS